MPCLCFYKKKKMTQHGPETNRSGFFPLGWGKGEVGSHSLLGVDLGCFRQTYKKMSKVHYDYSPCTTP